MRALFLNLINGIKIIGQLISGTFRAIESAASSLNRAAEVMDERNKIWADEELEKIQKEKDALVEKRKRERQPENISN